MVKFTKICEYDDGKIYERRLGENPSIIQVNLEQEDIEIIETIDITDDDNTNDVTEMTNETGYDTNDTDYDNFEDTSEIIDVSYDDATEMTKNNYNDKTSVDEDYKNTCMYKLFQLYTDENVVNDSSEISEEYSTNNALWAEKMLNHLSNDDNSVDEYYKDQKKKPQDKFEKIINNNSVSSQSNRKMHHVKNKNVTKNNTKYRNKIHLKKIKFKNDVNWRVINNFIKDSIKEETFDKNIKKEKLDTSIKDEKFDIKDEEFDTYTPTTTVTVETTTVVTKTLITTYHTGHKIKIKKEET